MSDEDLYHHPAFEEGRQRALACISRNDDANRIAYQNPHPYNTVEWRAWNLGWNTTLRSEQP